ncbi:MAG: hypothetical protein IVW57_13865 [Ktedonobacterales bacterium]|nr:hypothetical protein [Ktedonobacterales bacterium]
MRHGTNRLGALNAGVADERRLRMSVLLTRLTVADGAWLGRTLPALARSARPQPGAVRLEDVVLRYRPGRLGIADAMDATASLLQPFAVAGAEMEHRSEWYIANEDDEDEELFGSERPMRLDDTPEQDLLVSVRVIIDAIAEDAGAATLYWAVLALAG